LQGVEEISATGSVAASTATANSHEAPGLVLAPPPELLVARPVRPRLQPAGASSSAKGTEPQLGGDGQKPKHQREQLHIVDVELVVADLPPCAWSVTGWTPSSHVASPAMHDGRGRGRPLSLLVRGAEGFGAVAVLGVQVAGREEASVVQVIAAGW
jgi:hypothetical protein